MKFNPKSEQELEASLLIPQGIYDFEVIKAEDTVSKSGNDMIKLQLKVWDKEGKVHILFDYLLEQMHFKLRHFAEYTGMLDKYELGCFEASDCVHRCGQAEVIVQEAQGNFPTRNSVKDYVKVDKSAIKQELKKVEEFFDDSLPF